MCKNERKGKYFIKYSLMFENEEMVAKGYCPKLPGPIDFHIKILPRIFSF